MNFIYIFSLFFSRRFSKNKNRSNRLRFTPFPHPSSRFTSRLRYVSLLLWGKKSCRIKDVSFNSI
jgi:hypothetical protein